ncbi:hypothetical protein FSARC_12899 [Fusarium sarcochroum]|uniref:RING-type E3 ubiquitin transferase n=1 Tax=Fusarium sarcochroum TaxID=1208366 RepID=A0A8H4T542_9HYPO|nr:hypothetical protein FSARC_12899 [Fusarium sarcochroum]
MGLILYKGSPKRPFTRDEIIELKHHLDDRKNSLPEPLQPEKLVFPLHMTLHVHYHQLVMAFAKSVIGASYDDDTRIQDLYAGKSFVSVLDEAQIMLEAVMRLYYIRHDFDLYDPSTSFALTVIGNMTVAYLAKGSSSSSSILAGYRYTLILSAQGLNKEGLNYYVGPFLSTQNFPQTTFYNTGMGNIFGHEGEPNPPPVEPLPWAPRPQIDHDPVPGHENRFQARHIQPKAQPRPCSFFARGKCSKGTVCRFSHEEVSHPQETCRFFARWYCMRGNACKFSHEQPATQEWTEEPNEEQHIDHWARELGGTWAKFGDGATVTDVSLPSDFSAIRIRNLPTTYSGEAVKRLLSEVGITISKSDIQFIQPADMPNRTAILKVKDPKFAKSACSRLRTCIEPPDLEVNSIAVPMPAGSHFGRVDNRQVRCSWHRPTRTAWTYFSSRETAARHFENFNSGRSKVCGLKTTVQSLVAQDPDQRDGRWKMQLVGLSANITWEDIVEAMPEPDNPYQVDMGDPSYDIDFEMDSTLIKSLLYDIGPLERWDVFGNPKARRIKAQATFVQGSQAQAAVSSLNGKELPFNPAGKLFIQLITSVKFKLSKRVYDVVQKAIHSKKADWGRQFIRFSILPEHGFNRILKLEGEDRQLVAQAKKDLEHIITGTVMKVDGKIIWYPDFRIDRSVYGKLRKIERDLDVVIIRDVRASNFRVFGPEDKFTAAAEALHQLIEQMGSVNCIMSDKKTISLTEVQNPQTDCSVCFCEAEEALQTSCGHTYCSLCFVNMCQAEASTSGDFSIKCPGDSGGCKTTFQLCEIQKHLLSETFENILEASFASFIRHHPTDFRYCPTPNCDQVYRVASSAKTPQLFTCARCFTAICTACHVSHSEVSCAEYKGDDSGGMAELIKAKEKLGVKDCPKYPKEGFGLPHGIDGQDGEEMLGFSLAPDRRFSADTGSKVYSAY